MCLLGLCGAGRVAYAATSVLRGRPRGRLRATITPWTKSSPPQTPHGSPRSRAPERQAARAGHVPHRALANSTPSGVSANHSSASFSRQGIPSPVVWTPRAGRAAGSAASGCHLLGRHARWGLASSRCAGCGTGFSVGGRCRTAGRWWSCRGPRGGLGVAVPAGMTKAADPGVGIRGLKATCRAVRQVVPQGVDTRTP